MGNRRSHVGIAELGDDGAIDVIDQRMDDAWGWTTTWMRSRLAIEQPMGLDDFQAFVHHGGRIDRNLAAHDPVRMGAGRIPASPRPAPPPASSGNGPPGSGEQDAPNPTAPEPGGKSAGRDWKMALCSLSTGSRRPPDSRVSAAMNSSPAITRPFVGEQHLFARHRGQSRRKARGTDNGGHHGIDFGMGRQIDERLDAMEHFGAPRRSSTARPTGRPVEHRAGRRRRRPKIPRTVSNRVCRLGCGHRGRKSGNGLGADGPRQACWTPIDPGAPQEGETLAFHPPALPDRSHRHATVGRVEVRLSMRSSTLHDRGVCRCCPSAPLGA